MADHLVLVVHGIGEQKEGETVDQVVAGAVGEHERQGRPPLTIRNQVVHLPEKKFADTEPDSPKRKQIFPVHFKRIFSDKANGAPGQQQETVFAEVFWADKSTAPSGAFATIFDLVKILLAVMFLAIDNAENVGNKAAYRVVQLFCIAFFSGVLAINGMLLMGVIVLAIETQAISLMELATGPSKDEVWDAAAELIILSSVVLTALFAIWIFLTRFNYYLWRLLCLGLVFFAVLTTVYCIFAPTLVELKDSAILAILGFEEIARLPGGSAEEIAIATEQLARPHEIQQLDVFIALAFFIMRVLWVPAILACAALFAIWAFDNKHLDNAVGQRRIYAPISAAVIVLWMVMAAAFWQGVNRLTRPLGISGVEKKEHDHESAGVLTAAFDTHLENALQVAMVGGLGFFALIMVAVYVVIRRHKKRDTLYKETNPVVSRLLLNSLFQVVFSVTALLIAVMICLVIAARIAPENEIDWVANTIEFFQKATPVIAPALLLVGIIVYRGSETVAGMLGTLRDIVVYASSNKSNPSMKPNPKNFPDRFEIEYRFRRVFDYMVENERPSHLTIICHSQGTVVTTRSMRKIMRDNETKLNKCTMGCTTTLVTMGSPVTHLYRQYFPRDFCVPETGFDGVMWHNIHRADDFVGTEITGVNTNIQNHPVPAGGHPGYFTDPTVWAKFDSAVEFSLCDQKPQVPAP